MSGLLPTSGRVTRGREWSIEEDYFLLDHPELTAAEAGAELGRTKRATCTRRWRLKSIEMVDFVKPLQNLVPFRAGQRTILAKTCLGCGLLVDARWFARHARTGCLEARCRRCRADIMKTRHAQNPASQRARDQRRDARYRLQQLTVAHAERGGQEWTHKDMEILEDRSLSLTEMALATQRTYYAVSEKRKKLGLPDVRVIDGDPADAQWVIRFLEAHPPESSA